MKSIKLALSVFLIATLGFISLPNILAGQTGGETPVCEDICTDLCGEATTEDCQYTYCYEEPDQPGEEGEEGTYMCKGVWQG